MTVREPVSIVLVALFLALMLFTVLTQTPDTEPPEQGITKEGTP